MSLKANKITTNYKSKNNKFKNILKNKINENQLGGFDLSFLDLNHQKKIIKMFKQELGSNLGVNKVNIIPSNLQNKLINNLNQDYDKKYSKLLRYQPILTQLIDESISDSNQDISSPKISIFHSIINCNQSDLKPEDIIKIINNFEKNPVIYLPSKHQCCSFRDSQVTEYLVKRLKRRTKINPGKMICPEQTHNNCWFNTGLMIYFFSDLGRKYNRFLRHTMITGQLGDISITDSDLGKFLFIFNLYIEACHLGESFSKFIDTNYLVDKIYHLCLKRNLISLQSGQYGNPSTFFKTLITTLRLDKYNRNTLDYLKPPINLQMFTFKQFKSNLQQYMFSQLKEIEILRVSIINPNLIFNPYIKKHPYFKEIINSNDNSNNRCQAFCKDKMSDLILTHNGQTIHYKLDSILLRSVDESHFCCGITLNKELYLYDGANQKMLTTPFNWIEKMNKDEYWVFEQDIMDIDPENCQDFTTYFNFLWGYQELFYYRVQ